MKTVTVHGLTEEMMKLIIQRAKSEAKSVNRTVKELLAKALGLHPEKKDQREDFLDLFGTWTDAEEKRFRKAIRDLETVHPEDWA